MKKTKILPRFVLIMLFMSLNIATTKAQSTTRKSDNFTKAYKQFGAAYEQELQKSGIVGSSFMFVRDTKVAAKKFWGIANLEKNQAVDEDTIYHWASITKTFTGIATMQLRDRGLLKLDDSVVKYLPELRAVHNPYGDMSEITIRQLLSHSAGFRNPTFPWKDEIKDWQPHEPQDWEQLVAMFPYTEIKFKPGSRYSYSNLGIVFLGRIIELITKDDYEVYIDKNIFKPLEMYRSYFDATPYHLLKYRSHSYFIENGKRTPGRFDVNTGITVSNGGLNSPLPDMVKYLNFLVGDPTKQDVYEGVLKRASLEEMWQPVIESERDALGNTNNVTNIGLAFFLDARHGLIGHSGDQNGFIMYIDFRPKTRCASILAFNTNLQLPDDTPLEKNPVQKLRIALRALFQSIDNTTK
ncbi:MAG: beta-lactamase family protein [Acidobacteria bacterium]|nr:beta-lactamase family protein [Acidobacteriota bacterium]